MRQTGNGHLVFWQRQVAGFVQDEVKVASNLSLAAGVRYEWQNYGAGYHNFAPRLSFAYGVGKGLKTVLRGGAGFFYDAVPTAEIAATDRKSTRLNSSHLVISYAVFCLKKKKKESL